MLSKLIAVAVALGYDVDIYDNGKGFVAKQNDVEIGVVRERYVGGEIYAEHAFCVYADRQGVSILDDESGYVSQVSVGIVCEILGRGSYA